MRGPPGIGFLLAFLLLALAMQAFPRDFLPGLGEDIQELFSDRSLAVIGVGIPCTAAAFMLEDPEGSPGLLGDGALDDAATICHHAMGLPLLGGSAALWGVGALGGSPNAETTGRMLTEGLILTYGVTGILKLGAGRERPDGSNFRSFPSAHSSGSACAAVIMWDRHGPWAGLPLAALAAFTAVSRVHMGRHYPSDVIAGVSIGLAAGLAVVEAWEDEVSSDEIQPAMGFRSAMGVRWSSSAGFGVYLPYEE